MIWVYVGDLADWTVARLIDSAMAGEQMPAWAPWLGLLLTVLGAAILAAWTVRAYYQRRAERNQPARGNLLDARPWLAIDPYTIDLEPEPGYRGRRRASRNHVVPAHPPRAEVAATQIVPRVSDEVDATVVIAQPHDRWGAR